MILAPQLLQRPLAPLPRRDGSRVAPARRRHAARSLLWGAVALVLLTAAFSAAVETVLPQVRDPEYGYRLVRLRAQQRAHPDRPLVLVMGTSRTQNAIDPVALGFPDERGAPLVFNFGQSGSRPPHLRLTQQRLRADGVKPAAVLVEILPATLAFTGRADDLLCKDSTRLTGADVRRLEPYLDDPSAFRERRRSTRLNPWTAHRVALLSHLGPALQPWPERVDFHWILTDARGFSPYPHTTVSDGDRERLRARAFANYGEALRDLRINALAVRCFRDLVRDGREHGVPTAFFLTPESPVFRSWYSPASRAALAAFTRTLSDELGCPVFEVGTVFTEEDFADGHHILRPAAARFSRALGENHLKSWLANGR